MANSVMAKQIRALVLIVLMLALTTAACSSDDSSTGTCLSGLAIILMLLFALGDWFAGGKADK